MRLLRNPFWGVGLCLLAVLFLVGSVRAGDPWNDKSFRQWNKDEADKVLKDSPWGRRIATKTEFSKDADKGTGGINNTSATDRGEMRPTEFATVVWWSSRTPRRAWMRMIELAGQQVTQENIDEFCETPMQNHMISLWVAPGTLAISAQLTPDDLKRAAWLDVPRLKRKIEPIGVIVDKDNQGKPERFLFTFPREADGAKVMTAEDKKISFRWKLPQNKNETVDKAQQFEVQFNPQKMLVKGEADY